MTRPEEEHHVRQRDGKTIERELRCVSRRYILEDGPQTVEEIRDRMYSDIDARVEVSGYLFKMPMEILNEALEEADDLYEDDSGRYHIGKRRAQAEG